MSDVIRIKPHHFVDIVSAIGRGQRVFEPHPYGHNVHDVAARVIEDRDAFMEMELGADDICRPCKHNVDGQCNDTIDVSFRPQAPSSKREYNLLIDERWCRRLALKPADRLTARAFCRRLEQLAGDITDIYRETPADRTARRAANLKAGIAVFLGERKGKGERRKVT